MILHLNSNHFSRLCIECNHHHNLYSLICYITRMQMRTGHNMLRIANNFGRRFGILCNVSFDRLRINCWRICILVDIRGIDKKCCKTGSLIGYILHTNLLQVYNNCLGPQSNIMSNRLMCCSSFYITLYLECIDCWLNDFYWLKQDHNHLSIELDLMQYSIMSWGMLMNMRLIDRCWHNMMVQQVYMRFGCWLLGITYSREYHSLNRQYIKSIHFRLMLTQLHILSTQWSCILNNSHCKLNMLSQKGNNLLYKIDMKQSMYKSDIQQDRPYKMSN